MRCTALHCAAHALLRIMDSFTNYLLHERFTSTATTSVSKFRGIVDSTPRPERSERWAIFAKRSQPNRQRSGCASIGPKLTSGGHKLISGDADTTLQKMRNENLFLMRNYLSFSSPCLTFSLSISSSSCLSLHLLFLLHSLLLPYHKTLSPCLYSPSLISQVLLTLNSTTTLLQQRLSVGLSHGQHVLPLRSHCRGERGVGTASKTRARVRVCKP
jgi:hypothetical protein